jgi:hypothetical protein
VSDGGVSSVIISYKNGVYSLTLPSVFLSFDIIKCDMDGAAAALYESGRYKAIIPDSARAEFYRALCAANPANIDQFTEQLFSDCEGADYAIG